ncbi:MAG: YihY/virulence factor BrkB family protein [Anaerolineae bacterium]|jgi:membrane protein|nr:YihY/virulence factor BrkB family protein [Anaerolineae bacterium]
MLQQRYQAALAWWATHSPATRALPRHLGRAASNFYATGSGQAAALAYYAIFSVFPLALLLAVAIGNVLGPEDAQEQIIRGLALFLPPATVTDLQVTLRAAVSQSQSLGLVALAGLLWAATGLFSSITAALDDIFRVPAQRSMWRVRLVALGMGLALVVLVMASFLTSGVLRLLLALSLELNIWISIGTLFLPMGLNVVIFALLFRYIPARHVQWDAVWAGALFGAVGWELAKAAFEWYLTNLATYSVIYGGIATGIVLLFWAYLIASIFLFSAELCARLNEWLSEQEQVSSAARTLQQIERYVHTPEPAAPPAETEPG